MAELSNKTRGKWEGSEWIYERWEKLRKLEGDEKKTQDGKEVAGGRIDGEEGKVIKKKKKLVRKGYEM